MATRYQFVDDSGETRLAGFLVPDPSGSIPSPITTPVVIDQADVEADSLEIDLHAGQDANALIVKDDLGQTRARIFAAASDGAYSLIELLDTVGGGVARLNAAAGSLLKSTAAFAPTLELRNTGDGAPLSVDTAAGATVGGFLPGGFLYVGTNAAPADEVFSNAGQAAIWFDATHGAAKLMVKAIDANGSIVTGVINLT